MDPHASLAPWPAAFRKHLAVSLRHNSPVPTGLTPGHLSRATSRPLVSALIAAHGGDTSAIHASVGAVVCGSANLQLQDTSLASYLEEQGTLYVPEGAVNAGAVIEGILRQLHGTSGRQLAGEVIRATESRVIELLQSARRREQSPLERFKEQSGADD